MSSLICSGHMDSQQLPLLVAIDRDGSHVLNQLGQSVRNSRTNTGILGVLHTVAILVSEAV